MNNSDIYLELSPGILKRIYTDKARKFDFNKTYFCIKAKFGSVFNLDSTQIKNGQTINKNDLSVLSDRRGSFSEHFCRRFKQNCSTIIYQYLLK